MNLGKTASGLQPRALRRINAARRAPFACADTPGWLGLADQAQPGRRYRRGAKQRAAGMARRAIPRRQAQRAGRHRRPKASGIKAEWPRCAMRRGAQPASPTAARRMHDGTATGESRHDQLCRSRQETGRGAERAYRAQSAAPQAQDSTLRHGAGRAAAVRASISRISQVHNQTVASHCLTTICLSIGPLEKRTRRSGF